MGRSCRGIKVTKLFIGLFVGFVLSSVPILKSQVVEFELRGPLTDNATLGFAPRWVNYAIGREFVIQTASPSIKKLMNQMTGKRVKIVVSVEEK